MRVGQIFTVTTKKIQMDVEVSTTEETVEYALKDPIIQEHLLNEYPKDKLQESMNNEMLKMEEFDVADNVPSSSLTPEQLSAALDFTWVHR